MRAAPMLSLLVLACSGSDARLPDGAPVPAGDAATSDASAMDGSPGTDAAPLADGGPNRDAGQRDAGNGDAGRRDGGSDAGTPTFDSCRLRCDIAADCATASAAFDTDNYTCEAGSCVYTGCTGDAECASSFGDASYVCRDLAGQPTCQQGCSTNADCGTASVAFDADNYTCDAGVCRYTGCNDDAECTTAFADARYGCRDATPPDTGVPTPTATRNCVLTCTTAADCSTASAAFDADNYQCDAGICRYTGCNTDTECSASFMNPDYICR